MTYSRSFVLYKKMVLQMMIYSRRKCKKYMGLHRRRFLRRYLFHRGIYTNSWSFKYSYRQEIVHLLKHGLLFFAFMRRSNKVDLSHIFSITTMEIIKRFESLQIPLFKARTIFSHSQNICIKISLRGSLPLIRKASKETCLIIQEKTPMSKSLLGLLLMFMLICFNLSGIAWILQHQNDLLRTGLLR